MMKKHFTLKALNTVHKKNNCSPVVTVLMSCYNGETWLAESIESVLNQTFHDFEFILIDDGSSDNSLSIIKHFANIDNRIRVIEKENSGLPDSLNLGLKLANGSWIARIDADDLCEPNRLEKQLEVANSDQSLVLIGSAYWEMDKNGKLSKLQKYPSSHEQLKKNLLHRKRFFAHSSALYKTEAARKVYGYRPRIKKAEDYDLWLRLSEIGKMACIPEPLIRFRKHPDQISHEDAGRRHIADGCVALTSYWIRKSGYPDPVDQNDEHYEPFREWIVQKMMEIKHFEYRDFVGILKSQIANKKYVKVINSCLMSPGFVTRHIEFIFRGDTMSKRFARKWIGSNK